MTSDQLGSACPQCGKSDGVHSIQELAALAKAQLGQQPPGSPGQQQGWAGEPQQGPAGGWTTEPQSGPPRGPGGLPGGLGGGLRRGLRRAGRSDAYNPLDEIGADIAGAAISAAAGLVGRAMARRAQRTTSEKVLPTVMADRDGALKAQIEVSDKYPDLCACMTDKVIFMAGGTRVAPLPNLGTLTVEQADALVATLRS